MKKIINLEKIINMSGYGIKINDNVTVYPTNNAIKLLTASQMFAEDGLEVADVLKILDMLFAPEDIEKLGEVPNFDFTAMSTLIEAALSFSMNKKDITENAEEGDGVDSEAGNA